MPVSRAGCPARHTRTCSHGNFACREQYHHCRCRRYGSSSEVRSRTADCGETLDGNAFPIQTSATHSLPIVADTPLHHSSFDTSTGRPQNTLPCLLPYSCCRKCVFEYVSPRMSRCRGTAELPDQDTINVAFTQQGIPSTMLMNIIPTWPLYSLRTAHVL